MRRVVITGVGAVTPVGNDTETFWNSIKNGVCGVDTITKFDTEGFACKIGAEVKNFNPEDYLDRKEAKRMDRYTQFAMAAAKMALENAKFAITEEDDPFRVGVVIASGVGGIETLEAQANVLQTKGPGRVSPFFIPMMISNMAAGQVAIMTGAKGVNYGIVFRLCVRDARSRGSVPLHSLWGCGRNDCRWRGSGHHSAVLCGLLLHEGRFH